MLILPFACKQISLSLWNTCAFCGGLLIKRDINGFYSAAVENCTCCVIMLVNWIVEKKRDGGMEGWKEGD